MEYGPPAIVKGEDRVSDNGGDDAGDNRFKFELRFPIKYFRGKKGRPQGGFEDGSQTPGRSGQKHKPPFPIPQFQ